MGCLYEVLNSKTGKRYIGVTTRSLHKRKLEHISKHKQGVTPLQKAFIKHGVDLFHWTVLKESDDSDYLYRLEKRFISYLRFKKERLYNAHPGGEGGSFPGVDHAWYGKKHSQETIAKMKKSNKRTGAVLLFEEVVEIKRLLVQGLSESKIADQLKTTQPNINLIANGKRWANAPYPIAHG